MLWRGSFTRYQRWEITECRGRWVGCWSVSWLTATVTDTKAGDEVGLHHHLSCYNMYQGKMLLSCMLEFHMATALSPDAAEEAVPRSVSSWVLQLASCRSRMQHRHHLPQRWPAAQLPRTARHPHPAQLHLRLPHLQHRGGYQHQTGRCVWYQMKGFHVWF